MTDELTVDFEPLGRRARVAEGATLLEAARQAGVGLNAICGGAGTCGTCRVRVVAGEVSPPTEVERDVVAEGFRLACQTRVLGDVRVDVPRTSITAPQRAQIEGRERPVELDPAVRSFDVTLAPPSLADLRADATRLREALHQQLPRGGRGGVVRFDHAALCQLPAVLRENDWCIRIVTKDNEIIAVAPTGTLPLGLAVDIGTTKLAAYLVDLESGETLAAAGAMNPQITYGEDVMARIAYAMEGGTRARELQQAVIGGLDDLTRELCMQVGRDTGEIVEAVLVGNTCMHHLVLGLPVAQLGRAPYVPALADSYDLKARELLPPLEGGVHLAPGANVHLLPNIAGFVGADHVAMLLATSIGGGAVTAPLGKGGAFLLVPASERHAPRDLVVTRKDVNEIQLAKAAIRAGIEVLLGEAGLEAEQIERVVVAGAFGTYLDVDSALAVGMFPPLPRERFVQVGNAAGIGAKMALMSRRCRERAEEIARRVEYVELTTHPRFVELYMAALMLPEPLAVSS